MWSEGFGQIHSPLISNYSKDDHGGGTQCWSIESTKEGILHVGNNSGVLSFDGQNWSVVELPNRTFVHSIHQSADGHLYVGGQNEFGYFENSIVSDNSYVSLRGSVPEEFVDFEDVWRILEVGDEVFFCTERAVFSYTGNEIDVVSPRSSRFENFFLYNRELALQEIGYGLFTSRGDGFNFLSTDERLKTERLTEIVQISDSTSLCFFQNGEVHTLTDQGLFPFESELTEFTRAAKIYSVIRLSDGSLAVGTIQDGVVIANTNGEITDHFSKDAGLPNYTVLAVEQDMSDNIWVGLDNGLSYIEINSPFREVNERSGVAGTGYAMLSMDDRCYYGTNLGVYEVTGSDGEQEVNKLSSNQVWSVQSFDEAVVINGDGGAYYKNGEEMKEVSSVRSSWKFLLVEGQKDLAIQGTYDGFYLYRYQAGLSNPFTLIGKLSGFDESARIFEMDKSGQLWVSHAYRGLFRLKPDYENLRYAEVKRYGVEQGLPDDFYITVSQIRQEMVFGTAKGVYQYDEKSDRFQKHAQLTELIGEGKNIQRLIEDDLGNIWFCTDQEFGVIQIKEKGVYNDVSIVYFNQIQDDLVDGFEYVHTTQSQYTYIPTEKGFYRYDLKKSDTPPEFEFPLAINQIYSTHGVDSLVYQKGEDTTEIELSSEDSDLRFKFNLPTFGKLNQVFYQYKLDGEDIDWSGWTTASSKEYHNLPAGQHSFSVRAKNGYGHISETEVVNFYIQPPWYKTTIAQVIFVILGFLVLIGLIRVATLKEAKKTKRIREQSKKEIERKDEEHQRELEKSDSEIIRLRNEKLRAEVGHKNAELASTTMHLVQKSEMLQTIKKELDELSKESNDSMKRKVKQIQRLIVDDVRLDKNWERFENHFDQVHENFFKNLRAKYPELTPKDQKLCAYLRMNLATKEIAPLLNISVRGVEISRYRLRKKLNLDSDVNLVSFIMEI
jgi:DNA-binding CsgD family transcriptional regulator